ncbi:unnamed protein product [Paramecium octaurelia]|uniref:Uncharacterized protein n=1 Tax=Paramecium octaurelia TaxID=43137 RepID=A0A8S1THC0_PAROT|nr:unnamed protein product [Paramecium octaurelia]
MKRHYHYKLEFETDCNRSKQPIQCIKKFNQVSEWNVYFSQFKSFKSIPQSNSKDQFIQMFQVILVQKRLFQLQLNFQQLDSSITQQLRKFWNITNQKFLKKIIKKTEKVKKKIAQPVVSYDLEQQQEQESVIVKKQKGVRL